MREAIAFLLLACACGAATWSGGRTRRAHRGPAGQQARRIRATRPRRIRRRGRDSQGGFASLEALAAVAGARHASGGRTRERAASASSSCEPAGRDTCVRVAFEAHGAHPAPPPRRGRARVLCRDAHAARRQGRSAERGPVCVRKRDSVSAAAEGARRSRPLDRLGVPLAHRDAQVLSPRPMPSSRRLRNVRARRIVGSARGVGPVARVRDADARRDGDARPASRDRTQIKGRRREILSVVLARQPHRAREAPRTVEPRVRRRTRRWARRPARAPRARARRRRRSR